MLVQIAEVFEVPVSRLLGALPEATEDSAPGQRNEIAEQLMKINEQLVIRNNRTRKIIKWLIIIFVVIPVVVILLAMLAFSLLRITGTGSVEQHVPPVIETGFAGILL